MLIKHISHRPMLLEILENDKILVFYISYKIWLRSVHVFNLVYVIGNIVKWKWNCNIWINIKHCGKYVVFQLFNLILMLETKNCIVSKKPHQPIQTWFDLIQILLLKSTERNQTACFFILRFGWLLPSKPNQTAPRRPLKERIKIYYILKLKKKEFMGLAWLIWL